MTKLIARLTLFLNNLVFLVFLVVAAGFGKVGFDAYMADRTSETLFLTVLGPFVAVIIATLLCSIIALLGAIWLSIEEGNERRTYDVGKISERIDPTFSS
ncbi:MAG: hypothetical protein ACFE0S_05250 [Rhodospirillales bacterium]